MLYQVIEQTYENARYNAGSKARTDAYAILDGLGFSHLVMTVHDEKRATAGKIGKVWGHIKAAMDWRSLLAPVGEGDVLIIQLPVVNHSLFIDKAFHAAKKRGCKVIGLIHDLEELRYELGSENEAERLRYMQEGTRQRNLLDVIIVHNESMKAYVIEKLGMSEEKVVVLGIFDYLLDDTVGMAGYQKDRVIIAGNLKKMKAGYIYKLPESPVYNLYGAGLEEEELGSRLAKADDKAQVTEFTGNLVYKGKFAPDAPDCMTGAYGLVWDGEEAEDCVGYHGNYLRYNAPHKTSLYLACGLPVIIWDKAAMARFVAEEGAGITVASLSDVDETIKAVSEVEYEKLRENAQRAAGKIRKGVYLTSAVKAALERLGM